MNVVFKWSGAKRLAVGFGSGLGLVATLSQILLMREFLALPGIGELSIGMVLFCWLCFISAGAWIGKHVPAHPGVLSLASLLGTGLLPASLLGVRYYESIFGIGLGAPPGAAVFAALCILCTLPAGVLAGFLFTGFARHATVKSLPDIHFLYLGEGAGAAVAGPLYAFVLSQSVSPLVIMGLCGVVLSLAVAAVQPRLFQVISAAPVGISVLVCAGLMMFNADEAVFGHVFESQPARGEFLGCTDTHYHRLCMGRRYGQFQLYRDGQMAYVFPEPYDRPGPVHLAMAQHPQPRRVLILGGGLSNRMDAALQHHPESLQYLEFDPGELAFVSPRLDAATRKLTENPAVQIHSGTNRRFLATHPGEFDVIVQFTAPPLTAAENANHTVAFYQHVQQALATGGVFAVVSGGSANVATPPAAALLAGTANTLKQVFAQVVPVVDVQTFFFTRNGGPLTTDPQRLARRLRTVDPALVHRSRVTDVFSPLRLERSRRLIASSPGYVNRDAHPRTFLHTLDLQRWIRESRVGAASLSDEDWQLDASDRDRQWGAMVSAGILLIIVLLAVLGRSGRWRAEVASVATTGMGGMGLELILIYWFSVNHGGVYHHIAWLLSEFMFGLAAGAYLGHRIGKRPAMCAVADLSVILVLLATSLTVSGAVPFPLPTAALMIGAGAATGFAFPLFLDRISVARKDGAVPVMVAADHLGSAAGAVLVTVVWLPWFGLNWTCVLLLIFKLPLVIKYLIQKC